MSDLAPQAIYVTGASGFLGSTISAGLAEMGHGTVIPVARSPLPREIKSLDGKIVEDVFSARWFDPAHEDAVVVHCIGTSNPRDFHVSLSHATGELVLPHVAMVEALIDKGWRGRLLFLSSGGAIYGDVPSLPISETCPTHPKSPYGLHKQLLENALDFLSRSEGFEYASLRVSNPYGSLRVKPGQGVIPIVLNALMADETFQIYGDGTALRDYLHIDDLTSAIEKLARVDFPQQQMLINIGSGRGVSLNEVIRLLEEQTGRKLRTEMRITQHDVQSNVLDCSRAFNLFGWEATTPLESGLKTMVEQARAHIADT